MVTKQIICRLRGRSSRYIAYGLMFALSMGRSWLTILIYNYIHGQNPAAHAMFDLYPI